MEPMQLDQFADALDRHGGELARWPAELAAAARLLLVHSSQARGLHDTQCKLEHLLAADAFEAPPVALRVAILAAAPRASGSLWSELWALLGGARMAGPAFGLALLLGISLGSTLVSASEEGSEDEDLAALAYLSNDYLEY